MLYSFRWFQHAGQTFVKIPFFGAVSYLTIAVTPFCIVFAVVWGVYRRVSFAWIGQDILVRITIVPLLFTLRNQLKTYLSCLFCFWKLISGYSIDNYSSSNCPHTKSQGDWLFTLRFSINGAFVWMKQLICIYCILLTIFLWIKTLIYIHSSLKVGTVLLSCAFLYDIFWVFVSKWWFHESVMIVVSVFNKYIFHFYHSLQKLILVS